MHQFKLFKKICRSALAIAFVLLTSAAFSQVTIPAGSYIIKMDAATTGIAAYKPYGMIHELVKFYKVPIIWVVRSGKVKDAVDYQINGINYSAGLFIISSEFITPAVQTAINGWKTGTPASPNGYTRGSVTANLIPAAYTFTGANIKDITAVPYWTINDRHTSISIDLITSAGIPATQYNTIAPSQLGSCNDIYVMPQADPTWAEHGNLLNWNSQYKGAIWANSFAVSNLENLYNPANTAQQMNFLSEKVASLPLGNNSLLLQNQHGNTSRPPFSTNAAIPAGQTGKYTPPDDWVSQYIGVSDDAHITGPEQVYLPVLGGAWRSTTNMVCFDANQPDIPSKSPGAGALITYGRAFGDADKGLIMYESGLNVYGTTAPSVAAVKAFHNWSLLAVQDKFTQVSTVSGLPSSGIFGGVVTLSVTTTPVSSNLTYSWTAVRLSDGVAVGTFNPQTSTTGTTIYTAPNVTEPTTIVFTVTVTDACNRQSISALGNLTVVPVYAKDDVVENAPPNLPVTINVTLNDQASNDIALNLGSVSLIGPAGSTGTDTNSDGYIDKVVVPGEGTWTVDILGNVTFTPLASFTGNPTPIKYTIKNIDGKLSNEATITITYSKSQTDFSIVKTVNQSCVSPNGNIYTLLVSNLGVDKNTIGSTVTVTDDLTGFTNISIVAAGWTVSNVGNVYTFTTTAELAVGLAYSPIVITATPPGGTSVTNSATVNSATDVNQLNNTSSVTVYAQLGLPTVITPVTYCLNATATALVATGINLSWYTQASGGTALTEAPVPSTSVAGTVSYYVSQKNGTCESGRALIEVVTKALPLAPTTSPVSYCQGDIATPLTATGTDLKWYTTATGGTALATAPTPSTIAAGITTYYVSQSSSGCESLRAALVVTINAKPLAPTTSQNTYNYIIGYSNPPVPTQLTAVGTNLLWYTVATGGTGSTTAPTPTVPAVETTYYYYVSQNNGTCESDRLMITVIFRFKALSVSLRNFAGQAVNEANILTWTTSSESNNSGFEIQISKNGVDWKALDFVKGNGNSNVENNYRYTHKNPEALSFYRLKQIDLDGNYEYSDVIKLQNVSLTASLRVYPNPSSSYLFIEYSGAAKTPVRIIDINGRVVKSLLTTGAKTRVETNELAQGTYIISIDGKAIKFTVTR